MDEGIGNLPTFDVSASTRRAIPLALLKNRNFRNVWLAGAMASTVRWLDILAISVYVLAVSGSAFLVVLMFFLRMLPLFLFGVLAGAVAESMDRKKLLVVCLSLITCVYAVLTGLSWFGLLELWHLGIGVFLGGLIWALELSVRRTMIAEIAGMGHIGAAMGLDASTNSFTRMLGPFAGGFIFELTGLFGALLVGTILYTSAAILLYFVDYERVDDGGEHLSVFASIAEGFRFVLSSRTITGTLVVTIIFNLFGFSYISMVPVIAQEELGLSPFPTGILMSAEGCGAFIGCLIIAFFSHPTRFQQMYVGGTSMYLCCIFVFALSSYFSLSFLALWIAGFGVAGFATMQSALIISNTPSHIRTRVMGVLSMCIGFAPFGIIFVGGLTKQFGPVSGVLALSSTGMLAMIVTVFIWPEMLRRRAT